MAFMGANKKGRFLERPLVRNSFESNSYRIKAASAFEILVVMAAVIWQAARWFIGQKTDAPKPPRTAAA